MIKKQSGRPDSASVLGFVGMLLAARQVRSEDVDALVASVDDKIARLWLRLGPAAGGKRCDLIAVRRAGTRVVPDDLYRSQDDRRRGGCPMRPRLSATRPTRSSRRRQCCRARSVAPDRLPRRGRRC